MEDVSDDGHMHEDQHIHVVRRCVSVFLFQKVGDCAWADALAVNFQGSDGAVPGRGKLAAAHFGTESEMRNEIDFESENAKNLSGRDAKAD